MDTLRIETGLKEIQIADEDGNVACTVRLNPTDMYFAEKLLDTMADIGDLYTDYVNKSKEIDEIEDSDKSNIQFIELGRTADTQIREKINGLFGQDICTPLVGSMRIYAMANGFPVWANIVFAFIDLFDENLTKEKKKQNPRIEKYTKKYSRKR